MANREIGYSTWTLYQFWWKQIQCVSYQSISLEWSRAFVVLNCAIVLTISFDHAKKYIVACQRGGVSNKPLGQRQDTGPGILRSVHRWTRPTGEPPLPRQKFKKETNHIHDSPFLLRQGEPGTSQYSTFWSFLCWVIPHQSVVAVSFIPAYIVMCQGGGVSNDPPPLEPASWTAGWLKIKMLLDMGSLSRHYV